jgi:hypothetical protein
MVFPSFSLRREAGTIGPIAWHTQQKAQEAGQASRHSIADFRENFKEPFE